MFTDPKPQEPKVHSVFRTDGQTTLDVNSFPSSQVVKFSMGHLIEQIALLIPIPMYQALELTEKFD